MLSDLQRVAKRTGRVPQALQDMPQVHEDFYPFWKAFQELSLSRTAGGVGPNPIQLESLVAWMKIHRIESPELQREFYEVVTALDDEWFAVFKEIRERNKKVDKAPKQS